MTREMQGMDDNPYKSPETEGAPAAARNPRYWRFAARIGLAVAGVGCSLLSVFWLAAGVAGSLGIVNTDDLSFLFAGINATLAALFFWLARMLRR